MPNDSDTNGILPVGLQSWPRVFERIQEAAKILEKTAHVTPVHTSSTLNSLVGASTWLKCENFQRVGAFKFRGAYFSLSQLTSVERARGVLSFSSGNHAQALALAGRLLGIDVTVVMPTDAPKAKLAATRHYGATVELYDPSTQDREQVAANLPGADQRVLIPPFDFYDVIAGQGTAALEFHHQMESDYQAALDVLFVPVGGGGLLAGSAVAMQGVSPKTRVIGVEPLNADDAARSFRAGHIVRIEPPDTIADGTRTLALGKRNFALIEELVDDIVTVTEEQIADAVRFLFTRMKLVVEPSGALGVAWLLANPQGNSKVTGAVLSGGNIDAAVLRQILERN